MKTVADLLHESTQTLSGISTSPRLDAELLLAHTLTISRAGVLARLRDQVDDSCTKDFLALVSRRRLYEPVAYITGRKEFFGLEFEVNPSVLIPRPETETLVESALRLTKSIPIDRPLRVLDLGTGSGCIAVSLAHELKKWRRDVSILGVDISDEALGVARSNAKALGVSDIVAFQQGDWFSSVPSSARFNLIMSNPPYIAEGDMNVSNDISFEPYGALYSGSDGLEALRIIVDSAGSYISAPGWLICEIGSGQGQEVQAIKTSFSLSVIKDLEQRDRVAVWSVIPD